MKIFSLVLSLSLMIFGLTHKSKALTLEEYNDQLIKHGISWTNPNYGYYPNIYTGFSPRVETASRIHFHLGRGNQIRLTAVVDEMTVLTYLYNLKSRYDLIKTAIDQKYINVHGQDQFSLFSQVLETSEVFSTIQQFEAGQLTQDQFYNKSLLILKALNPGRVFDIKINLGQSFLNWKNVELKNYIDSAQSENLSSYAQKNPEKTITLLNALVWGRVNAYQLDAGIYTLLNELAQVSNDNDFIAKALQLFNKASENRYVHKIQGQDSQVCNSVQNCWLNTIEFTAIYPNGSAMYETTDRQGNTIPFIRENGLLTFLERSYHEVDHIRSEPHYGYAPKMDYSAEGNGIHNPAVRTWLDQPAFKELRTIFNIPKKDQTLWIVSRGNVSHGCTRMSAGHIWEVRNIFPSANSEMKKVKYFGNQSADYDLYDIDADGKIEVMGVQYYLSYGLASNTGAGYREGKFLIPQSFNRDAFLANLYGKGQYQQNGDQINFVNPYITQFYLAKPGQVRGKPFSLQINGEYKLYEQAYEKDKLQLITFALPTMASLEIHNNYQSIGKRFIKLFGKANSCGPFSSQFKACSESEYKKELNSVLPTAANMK